MSQRIIGIDFGTSNTYITLCSDHDIRDKDVIKLDGVKGAIPTEILYSDKHGFDNTFPIIGAQASETYGDRSESEREAKQFRFRSSFKPDIFGSIDAQRCAIDFLSMVLRDAARNHIPLSPLNCRVRFGVPADALPDYRYTLKQEAQEAGFSDIELTDEPIGAMLSDIAAKTFSLADMMAGYLIIDFGGGTCDFAYLRDGKIKHSWGDRELGGRLLDDVFYQWWSEQNPEPAQKAERSGKDFYIRSIDCQDIKIRFSERIKGDMNFNGMLQESSTKITGLSRTEFEKRVGNYQPSRSFRQYQESIGKPLPEKLASGQPVNIFEWFADCLEAGLKKARVGNDDICVVSLVGGSSRWYFVSEYCRNVLKKDDDHLRASLKPFGAISEGIALLPAIQKEFEDKKEKINSGKEEFIEREIVPKIKDNLNLCQLKIADDVVTGLFNKEIKPALERFFNEGGTQEHFKETIERIIKSNERAVQEKIEAALHSGLAVVYNTAMHETREWLSGFGLRLPEQTMQYSFDGSKISLSMDKKPGAGLETMISMALWGVVGAALLATPIGWFARIFLGAVGFAAALIFGPKSNEDKINGLRSEMRTKLESDIAVEMDKAVVQVREELDKAITQEVERLSIANV